ncbi:hypothetical protein ACFSBX_02825, partial [Halobellus rarus]
MVSTPIRVGFLVDGRPSDQQAAAREWASGRYDLDVIGTDDVAASMSHDVIWWHRAEDPSDIDEGVAAALAEYV